LSRRSCRAEDRDAEIAPEVRPAPQGRTSPAAPDIATQIHGQRNLLQPSSRRDIEAGGELVYDPPRASHPVRLGIEPLKNAGQCIDPNGGDKPEFGKIDAQTIG
jgi:hypothetical protein